MPLSCQHLSSERSAIMPAPSGRDLLRRGPTSAGPAADPVLGAVRPRRPPLASPRPAPGRLPASALSGRAAAVYRRGRTPFWNGAGRRGGPGRGEGRSDARAGRRQWWRAGGVVPARRPSGTEYCDSGADDAFSGARHSAPRRQAAAHCRRTNDTKIKGVGDVRHEIRYGRQSDVG